MSKPVFHLERVNQVGFVVANIDKSMETYWRVFGIGPWRCYTFGPDTASGMTFRGRPATFSMRIAQASVGQLCIELIQPLDGNTVHKEFLERFGEGLQHLGISPSDYETAVEKIRAAGYQIIQSAQGTGLTGDGAHVYFDTVGELGTLYEVSCPPSTRRTDYWYPAPPEGA